MTITPITTHRIQPPRCADPHCPSPVHDTAAARDRGCTSPRSYHEKKLYKVALHQGRPRRVPILGIRRRLQALHADGYTYPAMAADTGISLCQLSRMTYHPAIKYTSQEHAAAVRAMFRRRAGHPGPSTRARRHAHRLGWASSIRWDPAVIDDPAAAPDPLDGDDPDPDADSDSVVGDVIAGRIPLTAATRGEQERAVAWFLTREWSLNQIVKHTRTGAPHIKTIIAGVAADPGRGVAS